MISKSSIQTAAMALFIIFLSHDAVAQPINDRARASNAELINDREFDHSLGYLLHEKYVDDMGSGKYCFNKVLSSILYVDRPTTAQMIAMFSSNAVEGQNGQVFAMNSDSIPNPDTGGLPRVAQTNEPKGLYEVIDREGSCVEYNLLFHDENISQILYAGDTKFFPIEIIGVDSNNRIWGYFRDEGVWHKKMWPVSEWNGVVQGIAVEGSLMKALGDDGSTKEIMGLQPDGWKFGLRGDFNDLRYSRAVNSGELSCASRTAGFMTWGGRWARYRGAYCPDKDSNRLKKRTWYGGGINQVVTELSWEPARVITRLSHDSTIVGISTKGNLLILTTDPSSPFDTGGNGDFVLSVPIRPSLLKENNIFSDESDKEVVAIGGSGDIEEEGIFVLAGNARPNNRVVDIELYKVYWDGDSCAEVSTYGWKAKHVNLPSLNWDKWYGGGGGPEPSHRLDKVFGTHAGVAYFLLGSPPIQSSNTYGHYDLYRLGVGHGAVSQQEGIMSHDGNL